MIDRNATGVLVPSLSVSGRPAPRFCLGWRRATSQCMDRRRGAEGQGPGTWAEEIWGKLGSGITRVLLLWVDSWFCSGEGLCGMPSLVHLARHNTATGLTDACRSQSLRPSLPCVGRDLHTGRLTTGGTPPAMISCPPSRNRTDLDAGQVPAPLLRRLCPMTFGLV